MSRKKKAASAEATEAAKSNARRRAARKAGRAAANEEAGSLLDRFADNYDNAAGLPARRLKATTFPARLDRLKAETGATAPKKAVDLAEEYRVLLTQTAPLVAQNIAGCEARIVHYTKAEALDDAAVIRKAAKSSKNSDADLGPSPLAQAKADLLDSRRFAAAVKVLQSQVLAEIVAITGQAPYQNWLARVWKDAVLFEVNDSWTVGDAAGAAAKSEVAFSILWELYLGAIAANPAMRKALKAAWNEAVEAGDPMPTVAIIEARLHQSKAPERAALEADKAAAEKHDRQVKLDAQASAKARNPGGAAEKIKRAAEKLDRESVSS